MQNCYAVSVRLTRFPRYLRIFAVLSCLQASHLAIAGDLTDDRIARIISENRRGIFYAWSPHMPLSVEGYAEIVAATNRLGIAVTPVLNSHANLPYARDRARRIDMPEEGFAVNRSSRPAMRDLNVHAPAILIYANGEFVSPVIPGFRYAADYESLISRFLAD